jgi:hypothetical protein
VNRKYNQRNEKNVGGDLDLSSSFYRRVSYANEMDEYLSECNCGRENVSLYHQEGKEI